MSELGISRKPGSRKRVESATSECESVSDSQSADGGWGWVIVVASFAAHAIADGCTYSFGVLFVELLDVFGESRASTAWIGSLFVAMPSVCAPIASVLTQRYGCRITTITGGAIAAVGCILSTFANSVGVLCFTFGFISGCGLALVFIPAVLTVAFYFEKRRAFATGIAVAGSGIGTFIFAPLTEYLITQYSWRGALLIIGGLMLNLIVCGALFRPVISLSPTTKKNSSLAKSHCQLSETMENQPSVTIVCDDGDNNDFTRVTSVSLVQFPTYFDTLVQDGSDHGNLSPTPDLLYDINPLHSSFMAGRPVVVSQTCKPAIAVSISKTAGLQVDNPVPVSKAVSRSITGSADNIEALTKKTPYRPDLLWTQKHNDVFCRGGLLRARRLQTSNDQSASCPDIFLRTAIIEEPVTSSFCYTLGRAVRSFSNSTFDLSIFRSAIFILFCIHCFLLYLAYNTPYVYIPDVAVGRGISAETASTLVSVIGVASTVGQIVMGYVGDRPEVNTLHFYVAMTAIAGISTLVLPTLTSFISLAVYCSVYGFFISANYALTTIILVSLLGIDRLTNAFGLVSMAGGVAILVGPPLAGWVADESGSYDEVFFLAGVVIVVSGLILLTVPFVRQCDRLATGIRKRTISVRSNDTSSNKERVIGEETALNTATSV